jgi:hypothetical protein
VRFNAKRMQMEAERNSNIERENKILLGKMYNIMNSEPAYQTNPIASLSSLNMTVRKQEYDRIAQENQAIMQRILQRDSNFSNQKMRNVRAPPAAPTRLRARAPAPPASSPPVCVRPTAMRARWPW